MAPNFQSSFIPKGPITEDVFKKQKTNPVSIIAVSLFTFTLIGAVSLYFYKNYISNNLNLIKISISDAKQRIDPNSINNMYEFNNKLQTAKLIIANHTSSSRILKEIASSTVVNIFLTDFVFDIDDKGVSKINMKGLSSSYGAIAQQESVLLNNTNFKSVSISNISLVDKGLISFDISLTIDSALLKYKPTISVDSNQFPVGVNESINSTSSKQNNLSNSNKTSNKNLENDLSNNIDDISDIINLDTNLDLDNI